MPRTGIKFSAKRKKLRKKLKMKIYAKTGDDGTTSLIGNRRVSKTHPIIEANGAIDELSSYIALCCQKSKTKDLKFIYDNLINIRTDLSTIMAVISMAEIYKKDTCDKLCTLSKIDIEKLMDQISADLPKLTSFIVLEGTEIGCHLHIARTICRIAERRIIAAIKCGASVPAKICSYLNRLSDLLFVLARWANYSQK